MKRIGWVRRRGAAAAHVRLGLAAAMAAGLLTLTLTTAGSERGGSVCIASWKESPYRNYGYDHIVAIRNDCDRAVRCSVTTSVAPGRYQVTVGAGATERVMTYRGAPRPGFSARVACIAAR